MSLAALAPRSAQRAVGVAGRRPAAAAGGVRPAACRMRRTHVACKAMLEPEGERKKLTREAEPDQYWSSASEKKGANPFKDPLAIIGIVAILFPFAFLLLAIATGAIDTSVYR